MVTVRINIFVGQSQRKEKIFYDPAISGKSVIVIRLQLGCLCLRASLCCI